MPGEGVMSAKPKPTCSMMVLLNRSVCECNASGSLSQQGRWHFRPAHALLIAYKGADGSLVQTLTRRVEKELRESLHHLPPEEAAVLALLHQRLKSEASAATTA